MNDSSSASVESLLALAGAGGDFAGSGSGDGFPPMILNETLRDLCHQQNDTLFLELSCPPLFDSISCWPRTPPATTAVLPCFSEFKGVQYDATQNATRYCNIDGTWNSFANYDACKHLELPSSDPTLESFIELPIVIYFVGYTISLLALFCAVTVLVYFKELRCLRNTIHVNLFVTYIMSSSLWIIILSQQVFSWSNYLAAKQGLVDCIFLVTLFHYFSTTNFFWMLVEGLYLYMLVVQTFSGDYLRFWKYSIIGWGGPLIFVGAWAIAKSFYPYDLMPEHPNKLEIECSWMRESHIDWIIQGPSCAVLVINLIFLLRIMWVLITKLRSANTVETRQYRKASKALLVLIPLLGITYLVVIYGPHEGVGSRIFAVTRAVLLSTQGLVVSLLYCFLNYEVRGTLRLHYYRWRDERNIRLGIISKHRRPTISGTESIRTLEYSVVIMKSLAPPSSRHHHHHNHHNNLGGSN
ncbi:diuretic hormone receptor isoform X1 [Aedes aegypti]|uniref:Diuretic hormone receptor n=1 Tax=Aedes aegypti TaxID=7159 RepID=A0A6I8TFK5_AEDAE|nr:diuretic hormone receptor isoform X1 [Aedes aegypti]XP_021696800.1 diuretic hormone receptor isoform X1 [Aedes aegypti]XP_021696802.1 diuretic hormone receptor isoform X1 [Aedes aegypti]